MEKMLSQTKINPNPKMMEIKITMVFIKAVFVYVLSGWVVCANLGFIIGDITVSQNIKDIETVMVSIVAVVFTCVQIKGKVLDNRKKSIQIKEHIEKRKNENNNNDTRKV